MIKDKIFSGDIHDDRHVCSIYNNKILLQLNCQSGSIFFIFMLIFFLHTKYKGGRKKTFFTARLTIRVDPPPLTVSVL